jgi:uncharacterized membrane protein YbhN (UPF0104 family)
VSETPAPSGLDLAAAGRRAALFAVIAVVVVVAVSTLPGVGEIRDRLDSADPAWIAAAAACRIASMLGYVRALWAAFDRMLPWRRAFVLGLAEQGANVLLPAGGAGGPALGAYVLRRLGVPGTLAVDRHTALFLATSAVSFAALVVAGLLVGIGALEGNASPVWTLLPAGLAAAVIGLAVVWARRPPPEQPRGGRVLQTIWRVRRFLHDAAATTLHMLRHGDPYFVTGSVGYFAFDVASLACMFEAFGGGGPPVGEFVVAYALGHAGALLPTPGGLGGTEGGLIGMFVVFGTPLSLAAAAVLGYRVFQLGLPAVFGAAALVRVRYVLAHPPPPELVAARFSQLEP